MPRVFDNVNLKLIDSLTAVLSESHAADFCVGYLHLRGWSRIQPFVADLADRRQAVAGTALRIANSTLPHLRLTYSPSSEGLFSIRRVRMVQAIEGMSPRLGQAILDRMPSERVTRQEEVEA